MRHGLPQTFLAAPLATLALATIGCGSSDDAATAERAKAATAATPATTATSAPATTPTTTAAPGSVLGSNGKMYRCIGPSLLDDLRVLDRRIDRGRRSLKRMRTELRSIKRRYPGRVAPQRVAQRYNYLVRKHNALLRLGNRRIRAYNARLERDCTRG